MIKIITVNNYKNIKYVTEYIFVLLLVIYAGKATTFVRSVETWENLAGVFLPLLFVFYYGFKKRIIFSKKLMYLSVGFLVYFIMVTIKFSAFHPRFLGIHIFYLFVSYVLIAAMELRYFQLFEKVIYHLCIIALVFWVIQIIYPAITRSILSMIAFSKPGASNVSCNILVYTINSPGLYEFNIGQIKLFRNSGFAWEPGAFACYTGMALLVNLLRGRFLILSNKRFWIILIALLSTFSTTGYIILIVLVMFYLYNKKLKYILIFSPIAIYLIFYIISLPFMLEKVTSLTKNNTNEIIRNSLAYGTHQIPQRIVSFQIDFIDFLNNPVLGYGGHSEEKWTEKRGADIATISGIGKILAVFGVIGASFFFINLLRSSKNIAKYYYTRGWLFILIIILVLAISYSIIFEPVIMSFWLFSLYNPRERLKRLLKRSRNSIDKSLWLNSHI